MDQPTQHLSVDRSYKQRILSTLLIIHMLVSQAAAQISLTTTPREPLPDFAQFARLASARGQANIDAYTIGTAFTAQQTAGYNSPMRGDGFAWGTWAINLADTGSGLPAQTMTALALGCGNNLSEPVVIDGDGSGGTMACFIEPSTYGVGCAGSAFPTPVPTTGTYFRIGVGFNHACALSFDSQYVDLNTLLLYDPADRTAFKASIALVCWGMTYTETNTSRSNKVMPFPSTSSDPYYEVGCGFSFTCVRTLLGRVYCGGKMVYTTFELEVPIIIDASSTNQTTYYGAFSVGPSNWCGVDNSGSGGTSGVLRCYGAGLVSEVNSIIGSTAFAHGQNIVSVSDTSVCALRVSTGKIQCYVSPRIERSTLLAARMTSGCDTTSVYQIGSGRDWCCVLTEEFFVDCFFDEAIDPFAPQFEPDDYNFFTCVQKPPVDPCIKIKPVSFPDPEFDVCADVLSCGDAWIYSAMGASSCTQFQVEQYIYFDIDINTNCGPKISYIAKPI